MTTAADMITQCLKDIEVIGEAETASAETLADALTALNQMLALWALDGMYVYAQTETSFTPTGALSYTVGPGGAINIARPSQIDHAYWRSGNVDHRIQLLNTFEEYQNIGYKGVNSTPDYAYYLPSYPLGVLYLFPQPSTGTVKLTTRVEFPVLTAAADTLTIPPEFELVVRYSLDELLSVNMTRKLRPDIAANAAKFRKVMKRSNLRIKPLETVHGHGFNIQTGS